MDKKNLICAVCATTIPYGGRGPHPRFCLSCRRERIGRAYREVYYPRYQAASAAKNRARRERRAAKVRKG